MNVPTLIRRVGTPASRAPIGLPPVATVYTPQRVLARITWAITVITTAQMKPENRAPPSTSVIPPSGAGFGKPSEIVSVNPLRKNSIPSVVMNDGTPVVTVRIPLTAPTDGRAEQPEHDGERQREPPLEAEPHHERRHPVDVPEREVDLAGDQQHRLADGEDRDGGGVLGDHAAGCPCRRSRPSTR